MARLLIATTNQGKVLEFAELLADLRSVEVIGLRQIEAELARQCPPPEETGLTFEANAAIKAIAYAQFFALPTLADDSGLAIDALNGKPGVHSARWAHMHQAGLGDAANNQLVLQQLADAPAGPARAARFVCALAVALPDGTTVATAYGEVTGEILHAPRGSGGFGYDPLFFIPALGMTSAECTAAQKHAISHRGRAVAELKQALGRTGLASAGSPL